MNGLKEWATVVRALEHGKQTVILRKGGILETASGFKIESKKFLLFPTWEHQEAKHVKSEYHDFLNQTLNQKPKEGYNTITSIAEVLDEKDISADEIMIDNSPIENITAELLKDLKTTVERRVGKDKELSVVIKIKKERSSLKKGAPEIFMEAVKFHYFYSL